MACPNVWKQHNTHLQCHIFNLNNSSLCHIWLPVIVGPFRRREKYIFFSCCDSLHKQSQQVERKTTQLEAEKNSGFTIWRLLSAPNSVSTADFSRCQVLLHLSVYVCMCVCVCVKWFTPLPDTATDNDLVLEQQLRLAMTPVAMVTACNGQRKLTMLRWRPSDNYRHSDCRPFLSVSHTVFVWHKHERTNMTLNISHFLISWEN